MWSSTSRTTRPYGVRACASPLSAPLPSSPLHHVRAARMLFIVGRGRSGTTLLSRMLDGHPRIAVAPEALFVMNLRPRYGQGRWSAARGEAFFRDLLRERRLTAWNLDRAALRNEILEASGAGGDFATLCKLVYACYGARHGKRDTAWLGDKNPHYALFVPALMEQFPEARFVHIVRDYRDNILSYQGVRFDLNPTAALAGRWRSYNTRILRARQRAPERFLRVRHEDLVKEPERELRRLCAFLDVHYDEAMLRFQERVQGWAEPWHRNLQGPLNPGLLEQWRTRMPSQDQAVADAICGTLGASWGYLPNTASPHHLRVRDRAGVALGWLNTAAEQALFRLPLPWRSAVITGYRALTGSLPSSS